MKKYFKQILTLILCLVLCVGNGVPVWAANDLGVNFSVILDKETIEQTGAVQTIVMTLRAEQAITAYTIEFEVVTGGAPLTISAVTAGDNTVNQDWQYIHDETTGNYKVNYIEPNANNVDNIQNIVSIAFDVPADIDAREYTVGVEGLEVSKDYGDDVWERNGTATTQLTVTQASVTEGYTAGISASDTSLEVDDNVNIDVTVSHSSEEAFAAAEIEVRYDSTALTFDESAFKENYSAVGVTDKEGTLTLVDHGESKAFGADGYVYTLPFTAIMDANNSNVTLLKAGFATQKSSETSDLEAASLSASSVTLNIAKKSLSVTLPEDGILTGDTTVAYGGDYTFSLADTENYTYSAPTATMSGEAVAVLDNNDGTYTIEAVTGDLVITVTRTGKSYSVSFDGTGAEDTAAVEGNTTTATYMTDYTFTIPTTTNEHVYALESVTVGGKAYTGYSSIGMAYTIPGADIKGNIVINVTKTENPDGTVTVTFEGSSGVASGEATVKKGEAYTLTITPEKGYLYKVTATMGGVNAVVIDNSNNTYTIENVSGAIVFNITASADVSGISVTQYIQLDGTKMWLVKNTTEVAEGKVPVYGEDSMFWSSKYNAYCYLVVADALSVKTAQSALDIVTGTAASIAYDCDVNQTNKVDASDAQLVWNMYNAKAYTDFNTVTMDKFLEADINDTVGVDTTDAQAIINQILGVTVNE